MNENIRYYQYDDLRTEFREFKKVPSYEDLNSDSINLFVDTHRKRVWIWHGSNTTTKMKFIATKLSPAIRNKYGSDFKITAVDEGNETLGFKIMLGKADESECPETQFKSIYDRINDDIELLESLSKEKRMHLEKVKRSPLDNSEEEINHNLYCKHCGSKLTKNQEFCNVCGERVI
ncbi:MAG: hypothetical protein ACFFBC_13675 [Promethearchaeota archaeon]